MRSVRIDMDFDRKYATEADPWGIADARTPRYDLYRDRLLALAATRASVLDVGCGLGAFLARFEADFDRLVGVEIAPIAVDGARQRFPELEVHEGSAGALDAIPGLAGRRFSAVVCSDVLYYLEHSERIGALDWIADHLQPDGVALIAAYCPGGRYLTPDELRALVDPRFDVVEQHELDSDHVVLLARPRRSLVALTIDYETWQPIPEGRRIDWQADVFGPTDGLLDVCDRHGARLTIFAEVGEYLWLREHDEATADRMGQQWRDAVSRGHDVQLHLHPNWLPELGARRGPDGAWHWDWSVGRASDYPGDLTELIGRCCRALEDEIRPVAPGYRVACFRAGAYEAQPFERLHAALTANGIECDSSVYAGGQREDRSYDYRLAYSEGQPYFAARTDPQLKAPPSERDIVELPVLSPRDNERWTFDFTAASSFADDLLAVRGRMRAAPASPRRRRAGARLREVAGLAYWSLRRQRRWVNRLLLPSVAAQVSAPYTRERLVPSDYFVLIGHSKADLDLAEIDAGLARLAPSVTFVNLSDMARTARAELERATSATHEDEADRQVRREYAAVMSDEHNAAQARHLQQRIPRDRHTVLDLGCGAGIWSRAIAERLPWARVTGLDAGADFIARARERHGSDRVAFEVGDFTDLPFPDASFDCVYADNSLEHAFDADLTLREVHRVLGDGGVLVAAIPSDARNRRRTCDNHTWKTAPHDVASRLRDAGFTDVRINELDVFRRLGMPPYPPSDDRMMFVRGWKRSGASTERARAAQLATFVHGRLDPEHASASTDLGVLLREGRAWCTGYAVAAGLLLREEGYDVRWVTLVGDGPPPTGAAPVDAHEVVEVRFADGPRVLDAMNDVWIDGDILDLLRDPARVDAQLGGPEGRDVYATTAWYRRVDELCVRRSPDHPQRFVSVDAALAGALPGHPSWQMPLRRSAARVRAGVASLTAR